eukprot:scaffold105016_cov60-Phaeocystis_antarctica.AAC.1
MPLASSASRRRFHARAVVLPLFEEPALVVPATCAQPEVARNCVQRFDGAAPRTYVEYGMPMSSFAYHTRAKPCLSSRLSMSWYCERPSSSIMMSSSCASRRGCGVDLRANALFDLCDREVWHNASRNPRFGRRAEAASVAAARLSAMRSENHVEVATVCVPAQQQVRRHRRVGLDAHHVARVVGRHGQATGGCAVPCAKLDDCVPRLDEPSTPQSASTWPTRCRISSRPRMWGTVAPSKPGHPSGVGSQWEDRETVAMGSAAAISGCTAMRRCACSRASGLCEHIPNPNGLGPRGSASRCQDNLDRAAADIRRARMCHNEHA